MSICDRSRKHEHVMGKSLEYRVGSSIHLLLPLLFLAMDGFAGTLPYVRMQRARAKVDHF